MFNHQRESASNFDFCLDLRELGESFRRLNSALIERFYRCKF